MKKMLLCALSAMILCTGLVSIQANATTVSGVGGFARLDKTGGNIRWEVGPATKCPYSFSGELDYSDGHLWPVSGAGALGSTTSSTAPAFGKGAMSVTLTGVAESIDFENFVVVPGCTLGYYN